MQEMLHFVITLPLFRPSASRHALFIYFVIRSLHAETTGVSDDENHELEKKRKEVLFDQLIQCIE